MLCISLFHKTERWEMWIEILWLHLSLCRYRPVSLIFLHTNCLWQRRWWQSSIKPAHIIPAQVLCRSISKAQSWLSNGVHKGSSWPATLGGSLTLCRDVVVLLITKRVEAKRGEGRKGRRCNQLLQCCCALCRGLDRWDLCGCYLAFIYVPPSSTKQKRNIYGLSWCFVHPLNITLLPHILEQ